MDTNSITMSLQVYTRVGLIIKCVFFFLVSWLQLYAHAETFSGMHLIGVEETLAGHSMNLATYSVPKISRDPKFLPIWSCSLITGGKRFCEDYDECKWKNIAEYKGECVNRRSDGESNSEK